MSPRYEKLIIVFTIGGLLAFTILNRLYRVSNRSGLSMFSVEAIGIGWPYWLGLFTNGNLRNSLRRGGSECPDEDMERIKKDFMNARVAQLSGATENNPIRVSAQSVSDLHNATFSNYSATDGWRVFPVFGGDVKIFGIDFGNRAGWKWCSAPACQP